MLDRPKATPENEPSAPSAPPSPASLLKIPEETADRVFFGPNGLRAGWRLGLFVVFQSAAATILASLRGRGAEWLAAPGRSISFLTPQYFLIMEPVTFVTYLVAAWIMGRAEGRTIADYGLPGRGLLSTRFLLGIAAGFAAVSTLLGALHVAGVFHLEGLALHGSEALTYGALWAGAFLLVALQEEFRGRGYEMFTLVTGLGFWPAALLTSIWFGYTHRSNYGETAIGLLSVGAIGVFFCVLLRKTGDLWVPLGFHAAWDFGLTYVYGAPDSGLAETGHLLNSRFTGPTWLSGGTAGPEASLFCLILIVAMSAAVLLLFPRAKYPNPEAVSASRRAAVAPAPPPSS